MEFINNFFLQGVIADAPYIISSRLGRKYTVVMWTKLLNVEMIVLITATKETDLFISELERGDIVTVSGRLFFAHTDGIINHPIPIILSANVFNSGIDKHYGIEMLKEADLSKVNDVKKTKLPWEKED